MNRTTAVIGAALPAAAVALIGAVLALSWSGDAELGRTIGLAGLLLCALPLVLQTVRQAIAGNFATDAIASIAIITAIVLRQPIPGLIIVLMQSGGEALDRYAQRRASRALSLLEAAAPRVAERLNGSHYEAIAVAQVQIGDRLLVRPGNAVPADAIVIEGRSDLDTAAITGEPLPLPASPGTRVFSGFINGVSPLIVDVLAVAADSQYERIVQLVKTAQDHKAPIQRLADRYAVWFTPLAIALAILTWLLTHDSMRVLAVLVIATPCPLILAAPVAVIGGINRAAKINILFRNGAALENLAAAQAAIFDKTGTLTIGGPTVAEVVAYDGSSARDLLSLIATVERGSSHMLAREIVAYARAQGIEPPLLTDSREDPGRGIAARVAGRDIAIGSLGYIRERLHSPDADAAALDAASASNSLRSYISVDARLAGHVAFHDAIRPDMPAMFAALRESGFTHIEILSGDDAAAVTDIASKLDVDGAHAGLHPGDKLKHLERIQAAYGPAAMIGDGTNDAPALAAASVGIAVTPRGGGIAAETADIILLGDDLARIPDAVAIARRTMRIARQSIVVGLALSACGMVAAAFGLIPPIPAALVQEAIDIAVIVNALRASSPGA